MHGPNQLCACGNPVGTLMADCLMQNELHLDPRRIRAEQMRAAVESADPRQDQRLDRSGPRFLPHQRLTTHTQP